MTSLVQGAVVIQDSERWLRDGAVAFDGENIEAVGRFDDMRERWPDARLLGGPLKVVIPGLANAHDHGRGVSTLDWGLPDGPLEVWRLGQQGRGQLSPYWQALYLGLQMLRSGVTTVVHHHSTGAAPGSLLEHTAQALRAYRELGLRVCFGVGVWDQQRLVYGPEEDFIGGLPGDLVSAVRARWPPAISLDETLDATRRLTEEAKGSRIRVYLAPQGPQWCSEPLLKALKQAASDLETGMHMHLLETVYQKMWADRVLGRPVVEVLDEWGILHDRLTCAHGVWLSEAEMGLLAQRGVCVSHNPSSNLRLRSGIARVPQMLSHGMTVGIGLDGMSFREPDMFAEMRLAIALGRPPGLEPAALEAAVVWQMATRGGTRAALGRGDLGVLEAGHPADLVVLDGAALREPISSAPLDPVELVIWRGSPQLVETVVVAGDVLLEHGEPVKANPAGVARQLNTELAALEAQRAAEPWREELAEHVGRFYAGWGPVPARGWG